MPTMLTGTSYAEDVTCGLGLDLEMDDLVEPPADSRSSALAEESDFTSFFDLPIHPSGHRSPPCELIDHEDFTPDERRAVEVLRTNLRACYETRSSVRQRKLAIAWCFAPIASGISFELCCEVLGMRPHVLRSRLVYEFYLRWLVFEAWPAQSIALPLEIEGELDFSFGNLALKCARQIWARPGIVYSALIAQVDAPARDLHDIIAHLLDAGYIGQRVDNLYLIGRNPDRKPCGLDQPINKQRRRVGFWSAHW